VRDDEDDIDLSGLRVRNGFLDLSRVSEFSFAPPVTKTVRKSKKRKEVPTETSPTSPHAPSDDPSRILTQYKIQKKCANIQYNERRHSYIACAQLSYNRENRSFQVRDYATPVLALEQAIKWQQGQVLQWQTAKAQGKRSFPLSADLAAKVKAQRGLSVDAHNGVFIVTVQKQRETFRKMFSYREDAQKAFQTALEFREQLFSCSKTQFQEVISKHKKAKKKK
jgi:hypothetical protein